MKNWGCPSNSSCYPLFFSPQLVVNYRRGTAKIVRGVRVFLFFVRQVLPGVSCTFKHGVKSTIEERTDGRKSEIYPGEAEATSRRRRRFAVVDVDAHAVSLKSRHEFLNRHRASDDFFFFSVPFFCCCYRLNLCTERESWNKLSYYRRLQTEQDTGASVEFSWKE